MPWKIDISQFICLLALNLDTNKIHDTCNNTWLGTKQKNIAFKDTPQQTNGGSLKQNTFIIEHEC